MSLPPRWPVTLLELAMVTEFFPVGDLGKKVVRSCDGLFYREGLVRFSCIPIHMFNPYNLVLRHLVRRQGSPPENRNSLIPANSRGAAS